MASLKHHTALCLALATVLVAGRAISADTPVSSTGLGETWPNATDVSVNPNWHVYVFQKGGTRYIQINDNSGSVRAAIARTPYTVVALPIGSDAGNVATPDEPLPAPASRVSTLVYQDTAIKVFVAPQANGTNRMMAVAGECKGDPIECSKGSP